MANLYLGLVHYPIYNKNMQVIATAVTTSISTIFRVPLAPMMSKNIF